MHLVRSPSLLFHTEVCVIGAGCVGLAIARALALAGREVLIVDKGPTIGSETSSRNSEVIHAGLYYPPHTLKARFCVQGKHQLYHYCRARNIPYNNCGKLIVAAPAAAASQQQQQLLESLKRQAIQNGVDDVRILTPEDVRAMEPQVNCGGNANGSVESSSSSSSGGALWSPSTGVLDSHSYMTSLLADAEECGTTLVLHTKVEKAVIKKDLDTSSSSSSSSSSDVDDSSPGPGSSLLQLQFDDGTWLSCDAVVNAAGLWAHQIARLFHPSSSSSSSSSWQPPRQYFAKGTYFQLQGVRPAPFQHLIYPVPEPGGLGVHATLDWTGQSVKFGPDVEWVDASIDDPSQISLLPDPQRGERFYEQVRKYWPHLPDGKLVPDYVGIRPKLNHPANGTLGFEDFRIVGKETHGVKGLVHLFGIESPGLTSSMAIADYVADLLLKEIC